MSKIKNLWQSKMFKFAVYFLAALIVILISFQAGRFVGFRQAGFSYHMGDNYYRAFEGGRGGGIIGSNSFGNLPGGHGAVGKIIKVSLPSIVISTPDNLEKTIMVSDDTIIRRFRGSASSSEFKIGDMVVVIGEPDQESAIEARLIRLLPPLPLSASSTNSR